MRKDAEPVARENERDALNFEIVLAILNGILLAAYIAWFFSIVFSVAALKHTGMPTIHSGPLPWSIAVPFGFLAVIFSIGVTCAALSSLAARAAWLGRRVRYPFAIPFVR